MSYRRKSRQGDYERTFTIPPIMWFLMLLGGIIVGFLFGTLILVWLMLFFSMLFFELAGIIGSMLTIAIGVILLLLLRRYFVSFGAFLVGIFIGIILAILWMQFGWWSPMPPGETDVPNIGNLTKDVITWVATRTM